MVRPMMWLRGKDAVDDIVRGQPVGPRGRIWARFARTFPWESMAAIDEPAVPLGEHERRWRRRRRRRRRRIGPQQVVEGERAVEPVPGIVTTWATAAPGRAVMSRHAFAAIGPMTAIDGVTSTICRSSRSGLVGLRGTATAPRPTVASSAITNEGSLPTGCDRLPADAETLQRAAEGAHPVAERSRSEVGPALRLDRGPALETGVVVERSEARFTESSRSLQRPPG